METVTTITPQGRRRDSLKKEIADWLLEGPAWLKYATEAQLLDLEPDVRPALEDSAIKSLVQRLKDSQAKTFKEVIDVTGLFLAKLDGTAKGGAVIGIRNEIDIPVKYIGLGETPEDIEPFDAEEFTKALFE